MWAIRTVPNLAECFSNSLLPDLKMHLLSILKQKLQAQWQLKPLLQRSNAHGKGMNRFWSNVEGYHGPLLLLISATSGDSSESSRKWTIGALTQEGFENKDAFYGSGGCLYSIALSSICFQHLERRRTTCIVTCIQLLDPLPKPVGIAFGGTMGHETIFIEDYFSKITICRHAADKTYQHGSLFPNQGYLPTEALVLNLEVWGLGGKRAKEVQISHQRREELFTEQRHKTTGLRIK